MDIEELKRKIEAIPQEYWDKRAAEIAEREKHLDMLCESGDHQGTLSNPIFSGVDIWWECSRCKKRQLQVGGNRPITI